MKLKTLLYHLNRRDYNFLPKNLQFTKISLALIICFTIIFFTKTILAAETNSDTGREETTTTVPVLYNPETQKEVKENQEALTGENNINLQVWTKSAAIANGLLVVNTVGGSDVVAMASGDPSWVAGGFIGATNQIIASLYSRPISGVQYIADSINSFLGKPVYAQNNDGFNQLKGLQSIWKICRNTVYTLISIVFVIMGLLIMLRVKISPQATVTVQNSIPKIITTLILVTFSYAICGLIIDATYLIQAVVLSLLINADTSNTFTGNLGLTNLIKGDMGTFSALTWNVLWKSTSATTIISVSALSGVVAAIVGMLAFTSWWGALCFIVGAAIVLIFVLIQIVKFFFGCAKAYIILLIKFVSAPLEIALGAFPNSKINFGSWFIQTLAYAAIFPICMIFLVFLTIVLNAVSLNQVWTPGVLQGGLVSAAIRPILGLAGLIILAKLPDLIPEAIFQIKPSPFGKAIGEGFTKNALVNRVRTGVNFATEQRIGNMFYGGYAEGQSAIGRFKSKYNIGKSEKKHKSIDQNPKESSINPQEEENTNSSTF